MKPDSTDISKERLQRLVDNGIQMGMERDRTKLLRHILLSGRQIANCDAATLYLMSESRSLRFALRSRDDDLPSFEIPLYDAQTGAPNEKHVSTYVALNNVPVNIDDVYAEKRFDLSGTRHYDAESGYRTVSMLTLPMAPRGGEVLGVLQFINALDPVSGEIVPFDDGLVDLMRALAAQAAVALDNQQLVETQSALLNGMIRSISGAIDAKSPYTGGHCERVPELAMMLAEAACTEDKGTLADFRFSSDEEWQEFRIGIWLHDCGKVVTPVHVVDKATKLETLYNRIHEIRTRFEVLLRDAEIERLNTRLAGGDAAAADARFAARKQQLFDDFAFLAECNIGGESMSANQSARIREIAGQTWLRHFDDRLGLAHEELARANQTPRAELPASEHLLTDRPEHIVQRPHGERSAHEAHGFRLQPTEHQQNCGEIYNLSIPYGTLNSEERYIVNEHIVQTIEMLDRLPFPKHLRRVPEYAGTHHETLTGSGYPRGLTAAELSIPARIVAIADVFEALTASDRPYKRAKKLSESVRILHGFKQRGHIDPELFDLFLTSGVYLHYAERFLAPEQVDAVDIHTYLG